MRKKLRYLLFFALIFFNSCDNQKQLSHNTTETMPANEIIAALPDQGAFRDTIDGKTTDLYFLKNDKDVTAALTNYDARLVGLTVPGKNDQLFNVVVGLDSVRQYQTLNELYYGYAKSDNRQHVTDSHEMNDSFHTVTMRNSAGGSYEAGKKVRNIVWDARQRSKNKIEFRYVPKAGEAGFEEALRTKVTYTLTDNNELIIDYEAISNKKALINPGNNIFFNLNGMGSGTVLNHVLKIDADEFLAVDESLMPTGKKELVAGTAFDFRKGAMIGLRIDDDEVQLTNGKGYHHTFILDRTNSDSLVFAANMLGDQTGILMDVFTTEKGLHLYTGNFMQGKNKIRGGNYDYFRTAFALEAAHFNDPSNEQAYPYIELEPGERYSMISVYKFSVNK